MLLYHPRKPGSHEILDMKKERYDNIKHNEKQASASHNASNKRNKKKRNSCIMHMEKSFSKYSRLLSEGISVSGAATLTARVRP